MHCLRRLLKVYVYFQLSLFLMKFCLAVIHVMLFQLSWCQQLCSGIKSFVLQENGCPTYNFVLDFIDEFDGNAIDTSNWRVKTGVTRDPDQKSSCQWYLPENVVVNDGTLKLRVQRDTFINRCFDLWIDPQLGVQHYCKDFFFTGSEIATKRDFPYGKFEIRCKVAKGQGFTNDLWIWQYKQQCEIDIFEFNNNYNMFGKIKESDLARVHAMNLHNDYYDNNVKTDCPYSYTGQDFSSEFHCFGLVWTPYKIQWLVDDEVVRTAYLFYSLTGQPVECERVEANNFFIINRSFPKNPMHLIANFSIASGKRSPPDEASLPAIYEIDYVKYWRMQ